MSSSVTFACRALKMVWRLRVGGLSGGLACRSISRPATDIRCNRPTIELVGDGCSCRNRIAQRNWCAALPLSCVVGDKPMPPSRAESFRPRQRSVSEGFADQFDTRVKPALMNDGISGIACRKEYEKPGKPLAGFVGKLPAIHPAGKSDVGEEQPHIGVGIEQLQRGCAVWRGQHSLSLVPQHRSNRSRQ